MKNDKAAETQRKRIVLVVDDRLQVGFAVVEFLDEGMNRGKRLLCEVTGARRWAI